MTKQDGNFILTAKQMRMADQYTMEQDGFSIAELMERAGQALVMASHKHKRDGGRILIIVGKGNNAADGFVAARLLRKQQVAVTVVPLLSLEHVADHVSHQIELAKEAGVKIRPALTKSDLPQLEAWLNRAVIVVDAIFGTGLVRPVTGWVAEAVQCINQANCPVLAVDIASGIDADSGEQLGVAINADVTLPIAAYKWGHWLQHGVEHSGLMLSPAPIGIRQETMKRMLTEHSITAVHSQLIEMNTIKSAFFKREAQSYKHTFGHLWILGGSIGYTGAPKLAAMGAQSVGAGLVSIACPEDVYAIIASASLEVMVHPQESADWQQANAIVAGPGWGKEQQALLTELLAIDVPMVLDADALNMLAEDENIQTVLQHRHSLTVLTPHAGEAARLLGLTAGDVQKDRLYSALSLVDKYQVWGVMKGAQTIIVSPHKKVWVNPFGSVNLATAGTGDVLAGMIGGLLAGDLNEEVAILAAVGLHGLAGEKKHWFRAGQLGKLVASEIYHLRNS